LRRETTDRPHNTIDHLIINLIYERPQRHRRDADRDKRLFLCQLEAEEMLTRQTEKLPQIGEAMPFRFSSFHW
jgi:hypothetical protein